jgi:tRNA (guanine37-N1)-methyltransferase
MPKSVRADDTPYGGGAGMVMRPDRLEATVERMLADFPGASRVMMSPRGRPLTQAMVASMVELPPVILCGHFEAVDQRVLDAYGFEEVSVADVVLSGGEVAAMVLLDACVRLLPGVIGNVSTHEEESFGYAGGLLEYSHYTKPASWCGREVPEVLLSGHHAEIARWRLETSTVLTYQRRPDVYLRALLSWAQGQGGVVE